MSALIDFPLAVRRHTDRSPEARPPEVDPSAGRQHEGRQHTDRSYSAGPAEGHPSDARPPGLRSYEGGSRESRPHEDGSHANGSHDGRPHQGRPYEGREGRQHEGRPRDARSSDGRRYQGAFVPHSVPVPAGSALGLVRQARAGVAEAQREASPAERYATAYLAALRAAAAMLALRGRPHRGRSRPTSAWVLLTSLAPELTEWAVFFAASSATRAAILAGVTRNVTQRAADDLVREAAQFTDLVAAAVADAGCDPDRWPGE
jgi:hypothetical protein